MAKERAACEKHEAQVSDVQQELQDAVKKYKSLEHDSKTQASELAKALQDSQEVRSKSRTAREELCQAE